MGCGVYQRKFEVTGCEGLIEWWSEWDLDYKNGEVNGVWGAGRSRDVKLRTAAGGEFIE